MKIRQVQKADFNRWSQMRTALWPDTNDWHASEIEEFFAGTSIDIAEVFVVELNAEAIGFIELNIRNFAEGSRNPQVPYVEGWYICEEHRGKGFGGQLMAQAEHWALAQGFCELASDTDLDNQHSIATHRHLGFSETCRAVCFLKQLQPIKNDT